MRMEEKTTRHSTDKNLKITIAVLSAVLVILFIFFLVIRRENRANARAFQSEKEQMQQELLDLSQHYDNLKTDNDTLNAKLVVEQEKIVELMEKMRVFRNNSYAEINRYKNEIGTLKGIMRSYVVQIDSLNQLNKKLLTENTQVKKQMDFVRERNKALEQRTQKMEETLEKASALAVEGFNLYPINARRKETTVRKCAQLTADFVIARNITSKRGARMIYLRITRPDGEVIAASEKATFKFQNVSLTYTARREIQFEGERLEVSIFWPNDGSLVAGKYTADLFCDNQQIGSSEFLLK